MNGGPQNKLEALERNQTQTKRIEVHTPDHHIYNKVTKIFHPHLFETEFLHINRY